MFRICFLFQLLWANIAYFPLTSYGQPLRFDITTQPLLWSKQNHNLGFQISGKDILPQLGIYTHVGFQTFQANSGKVTQEGMFTSFGSELRIYPLAQKPDKKNKWKPKKSKKVGCNFFDGKSESDFIRNFKNSIYVAPGFQKSKTSFAFIFKESPDSPVKQFESSIQENAFTLHVGLHGRFKFLTLDFGYGFAVGSLSIHDPWKLLSDEIYTTTYPVKLNITHGLRMAAGFNF